MFIRALSASEQATRALERFRRKAEALVEARRFCDEIRQHLHGGGTSESFGQQRNLTLDQGTERTTLVLTRQHYHPRGFLLCQ